MLTERNATIIFLGIVRKIKTGNTEMYCLHGATINHKTRKKSCRHVTLYRGGKGLKDLQRREVGCAGRTVHDP